MNLRDDFLPYKELIGHVILDKNPHIKIVVTKIGTLSNEFRTFDMEIIASRDDQRSLVATVSEQKMRLVIDYANCYWNSRLATERERLLRLFMKTESNNSRLIDMCCGVGALACFSAKEGLEVFANDLNPSAVACARRNVAQNKVEVQLFNMDARDFLRRLVSDGNLKEPKVNHVMINLPEIGINFMDVFQALFSSPEELGENEFRVYCHCFSRVNPPTDIRQRIPISLNDDVKLDLVHVRDVSPSKIMYSVEFTVPRDVLLGNVVSKKPRID
jgi:tRNA (guanine37-N1)-methyltransferase